MDGRALGQPDPEDPPVAGTWWWPSSQQDGPSGGKSLSMTQGLLLPMAAWERKGCSLDSPSLGGSPVLSPVRDGLQMVTNPLEVPQR